MSGSCKLVAHFDINGTITAVDSTEPGNDEQNANMMLSKCYKGVERDGLWYLDENLGTITYYDWLRLKYTDYKKRSFVFTHKGQPGHSCAHKVPIVVEQCGYNSNSNLILFNSFYRFLDAYPNAIITLRTFGHDTDDVLATLRDHPHFNQVIKVQGKELDIGLIEDLLLISKSNILLCFQENFDTWNNNERDKKFGKIMKGHQDLKQIFFDDNDCVHADAHPNNMVIKVDSLQAMTNPDYFIKITKDFIINKN